MQDAALYRARAHGQARLAAWTEDGTLVASATMTDTWAIRRHTLDGACTRGKVCSL